MSIPQLRVSRRDCLVAGAIGPLFVSTTVKAERMRPVLQDVTAPSKAFPRLGGGIASLDAMQGHVVVVAFWATWCAPCLVELPALVRLNARPGVSVIAVNAGETEGRIVRFLSRHGLQDLPVMIDPDRKAMVEWRVAGLPSAYVVAADHRIRYAVLGEIDWDDKDVQRRVQRLSANLTDE